MDQIREISDAAGVNQIVENGVLAIWPRGQARTTGAPAVKVSYLDGSMVGYPKFGVADISIECLFTPVIRYGCQVTVESTLPPANGTWFLYKLEHDLQALWPDGKWFSTLGLTVPPNAAPS